MDVINVSRINYEEIIDLIYAFWPKQFGELSKQEMIQKMYESNDNENDVNKMIIIEDEIVGWCRYTSWPKNTVNTKSIHLMDIMIKDKYQGKGFGSVLMKDMIENCIKNGNDFILSRTFEDNIKSIQLHKKNGFKIDFKKNDSIVWKYDLTQDNN